MERVNAFEGNLNAIIIAPHGPNDPYTGTIAKNIAKSLEAFCVVNQGFERSDTVDIFNDKANCNNVSHCHEDVVKDEFLDPIMRYVAKIRHAPWMLSSWDDPIWTFIIHGINHINRKVSPDLVIGYGAGDPPSHSCDLWRKNALIHILSEQGFEVFQGKAGGQFSGWAKTNLNQLYRKWYMDPAVQSIQIEVSRDWRTDEDDAISTAEALTEAIEDLLLFTLDDVKKILIPPMKEL
jgi:hypothetical protein